MGGASLTYHAEQDQMFVRSFLKKIHLFIFERFLSFLEIY